MEDKLRQREREREREKERAHEAEREKERERERERAREREREEERERELERHKEREVLAVRAMEKHILNQELHTHSHTLSHRQQIEDRAKHTPNRAGTQVHTYTLPHAGTRTLQHFQLSLEPHANTV